MSQALKERPVVEREQLHLVGFQLKARSPQIPERCLRFPAKQGARPMEARGSRAIEAQCMESMD
jgi:hypothetical protein